MYRILVVEDQEPVRKGIVNMIATIFPNQFEVYEAENGQTGSEAARKLTPNIILTDIMMPEMSGLEMVEGLIDVDDMSETQFIILTAFEEFNYAKRALQLGVNEYLIKPINEKQLFICIEKALVNVNQNNKTGYNDLVLYDFISGVDASIDSSIVPKYKVLEQMTGDYWGIAVFEKSLLEKIEFLLGLQIKLEAYFHQFQFDFISFNNYRSRIVFVFNYNQSEEFNLLEQKLMEILKAIDPDMHVGVSAICQGNKQLQTMFHQSEYALNQSFSSKTGCEFFVGKNEEFSSIVTFSFCNRMTNAINQNNTTVAEKLLDQLFSDISRLSPSQEMAQLELEKLLTYIGMHLNPFKQLEQLSITTRNELKAAKSLLALKASFHRYVFQIMEPLSDEKKSKVDLGRILDYVEKNYKEDISASMLANMSNMSYSYFCSFFSKTMKMSTSEYINDVRLRRAMELLESSFLKITDIAEQCGFSDYRYFSKLFKKKYGCSPSSYQRK